jgi:hypothetical protein
MALRSSFKNHLWARLTQFKKRRKHLHAPHVKQWCKKRQENNLCPLFRAQLMKEQKKGSLCLSWWPCTADKGINGWGTTKGWLSLSTIWSVTKRQYPKVAAFSWFIFFSNSWTRAPQWILTNYWSKTRPSIHKYSRLPCCSRRISKRRYNYNFQNAQSSTNLRTMGLSKVWKLNCNRPLKCSNLSELFILKSSYF